MKITLNLTKEEAKVLDSVLNKLRNQVLKYRSGGEVGNRICQIVDYFSLPDQTIAAIKAIRAASTWPDWRFTPNTTLQYNGPVNAIGLAEAKCIVDHYEQFVEFLETHDEMPHIDYFRTPYFTKNSPVTA